MATFSLTKDRSLANKKYGYGFYGDAGKAIVPVLQYRAGKYKLIGTAAYFGEPNWFITARHIFEGADIDKSDGFAVHFENTEEPTRLDTKFDIRNTDISICRLEGPLPKSLDHIKPFAIMNLVPEQHEIVAAYGYSHSLVDPTQTYEIGDEEYQHLRFRTKWEVGGVIEIHPNGRGHVKSECIETSILAEGRDSGAPIFNSNGFLVGILSQSFEFESGLPNSTFSSIVNIGGVDLNGQR